MAGEVFGLRTILALADYEKRLWMFVDYGIAATDDNHARVGEGLNGFAAIRHLSGCRQRRPVPQ